MCGIVGVIAKGAKGLYPVDVKIFEQMLFADQLRGIDGTGVFYDTVKDGVLHSKLPITGTEFLNHKDYPKLAADINRESSFVIGHNRAATKGSLTKENTHPFKEGGITLVHNGTLWTHKHLKDVEVDSHAITHSIADAGLDETLDKLHGAYTLVWHDDGNSTLNIIRNNQRPLAIIETKYAFYICSEKSMGEWLVTRNKEIIVKSFNIVVGTHYSFDLFTREWTEVKKDLPVVTMKKKTTGNVIPLITNKQFKPLGIGVQIVFQPIASIVNGNQTYLSGEYIDGDGVVHDIRYYGGKNKLYKAIINEGNVGATINAEVHHPKMIRPYYIVTDLEFGFFTKNNKFVTYNGVRKIEPVCDTCLGHITKKKKYLQGCNLNLFKGKYSFMCKECTEYYEDVDNKLGLC